MKSYLIAERYARALCDVIPDATGLDAAMAAMRRASALYQAEHDLRAVLGNAVIDVAARQQVLDEVLAAADAPSPVRRLARVLLKRGRIPLLPDVAVLFIRFADARLRRASAKVTSALPLDMEQQGRVQAGLEAFSGKAVDIEWSVNPDIIGGVVAEIDGQIIDGSLRARLERLKEDLLAD